MYRLIYFIIASCYYFILNAVYRLCTVYLDQGIYFVLYELNINAFNKDANV